MTIQACFRAYLCVFHPIWVFGPGGGGGAWGLRGGSPKGWVHNLLMQSFTLGSSKIEVLETCFCDTVIIYNDHPRYVKHVLGRIYIVFPLFCVCVEVDLPKAIEFWSPKMILQGVRHLISCLGYATQTTSKKGGYMVSAPGLGVTTSLRGDLLARLGCLPDGGNR